MKTSLFFLVTTLVLAISSNAQNTFPATGAVGIGTTSPNTKSLLEVKSTTKGVLFPRMTTAQRNAIGTPPVGLLIFQTDSTSGFYYYTGSAWKAVTTALGANQTLSNLTSPTAISQSLLPGTTGKRDLGSSSKKWRDGNFNGTVSANGATTGVGVEGVGDSYGVYGNSSNVGVYGVGSTSTSYGVYGNSSYIGVYGIGTKYGTYGSSTDGYGTAGYSTNSYGLYGSGYNGSGAFGSNIGAYGLGGNYGVYGTTSTGYGVYGSGGSVGLYGSGGTYGVYGAGTADGVYGFSNSPAANGLEGYSVAGDGLYATTGDDAHHWAGEFHGSVYSSTGIFEGSDARLKQNIRDFTSAMEIINQLHPRQFEFRSDGDYKLMNFAHGTHFGLIAQDLEKVLPNLVKNSKLRVPVIEKPGSPDANKGQAPHQAKTIDAKAVNYTELIPIIIKGMQEMSKENADLKNQVAELKQIVSQNTSSAVVSSLSGASLGQNFPNPFNKSTIISLSIPKESNAASIVVSQTGTGRILKSIPVSGASQVTLDAASLSAGAYTYTLYIDGKKIDSKQMVISK